MIPSAVAKRTIHRTTETGRLAYLADRTKAYRLASAASRDIVLTGTRHGSRTTGQLLELADVRRDAADALADVYTRDEALAVLLAAEHAYLLHCLCIRGRRAHDDPGRLRYRRAVRAWFEPALTCRHCTGRVFEVTRDVWLTFQGYEARCPSRPGDAPHAVTLTPGHPRPRIPSIPAPGAGQCVRCRDHLHQDAHGAWISTTTGDATCWDDLDAPLHAYP